MTARTSLFWILGVLTVHFVGIYGFDVYRFVPDFDVPMHFFGGFSVGLASYTYVRFIQINTKTELPPLAQFLFVWGLVAIIATWWEFMEFVGDTFVYIKRDLPMQTSLADTMFDLFLGGAGSWCAFFYSLLRERNKHIRHVGQK